MRPLAIHLLAAALLVAACAADDDGPATGDDRDLAADGGAGDTGDTELGADTPSDGAIPDAADATDATEPDGDDAPSSDTPAPDGADTVPTACPAAALAERLGGRTRLLVGGSMDDDAFAAAPFDLRYVYLAGDVADPPCASCAEDCVVDGVSCANAAGGCAWWGCWQWDVPPPGRYAADFVTEVEAAGAVPMFSYYIWLTVSGAAEGAPEIAALGDADRVRRYLADWRFFASVVADTTDGPVIAHVEPDLWGYGHRVADDPTSVAAAVSSAGAPECEALPDTLTGFARCLLAIARAEAPSMLVGFHASSWGAGHEAHLNADAGFDLLGHADETAAFMRALGAAEADLIVVEMSDRDAGFNGRWWDATDTTLPTFEQAIAWAGRVGDQLDLPVLWWQVPYGHEGLPNTCDRYEDNRVDYVFDHPDRFAAGGAIGVAFGAGAACQTTPASDDGHFVERAQSYFGGERPCLCGDCAD